MRNVQSGVTSRKQYGQAKKAPELVEHVAIDTAKWLGDSSDPLWGSLFSEACSFEPVLAELFCICHTNRLNRLSFSEIFFQISAIFQKLSKVYMGSAITAPL